jgi:hypothetical protein
MTTSDNAKTPDQPHSSPLDDLTNTRIHRMTDSPAPWHDDQVSEQLRDSLKQSIDIKKKDKQLKTPKARARYDIQLDRHEAKYVIPKSMVPEIVRFIRPFCDPDPHCKGDPPEYVITTLQLDSPDMALHYAKEREALNRFKLRVRIYDEPGDSPVFLEVKRKIRGIIIKSRTAIPFEEWGEDIIKNPKTNLTFKSSKEEVGFLEFIRLVREIGARPVVLIRYTRSSFFSKLDRYARVTFDRNILYQPTDSWDSWGRGGRWMPIDSTLTQNKNNLFSGVVLELKTLSDAPMWMMDLVANFELARTGHCKYSNAVWVESMFKGTPAAPGYAVDLLSAF